MKIVIVENPRPLTLEHYNDVANAPLSASLNCGYALAVARRSGWDAAYLDFGGHAGTAAEMAAAILNEDADLILFHWVYSWGHEQLVRDTLALLRGATAAPLGAFGLFPTLAGQDLLRYADHLDFILAGEFEETLADLLPGFMQGAAIPALPGIARRGSGFVPRPLINDLARLPIPDDVGANLRYNSLNIAASRGCYGHCSFCFIQRYYGCSQRRTRSVASFEQELHERLKRRSVDSLYLIDPCFIGQGNPERERVIAISRVAREHRLPFGCETRVDSIDAKLLETLAANGASSIFLGIESGCDAVLARIGKRITKQQIRQAVQAVQNSGIQLTIGFIMFEPDSTLSELEENYAFLEQINLLTHHDLTANLLYHNQIVLRGSAAWVRFEQDGRLLTDSQLPFEARYRFRDERVGSICAAMGRLASSYFKLLNDHGRTGGNCCLQATETSGHDTLNALLKKAFLSFCSAAKNSATGSLDELTAAYLQQLRQIFRQPVQ